MNAPDFQEIKMNCPECRRDIRFPIPPGHPLSSKEKELKFFKDAYREVSEAARNALALKFGLEEANRIIANAIEAARRGQ